MSLMHLVQCPMLIAYAVTDQRAVIHADTRRWCEVMGGERRLLELLRLPEFRSLFYYRLGRGNRLGTRVGQLLRAIYRGQPALYLHTREIGEGLFIQHGFATIVSAERIGANCWISQQVTIGSDDRQERPVIEDYVEVYAGAKIFGGIRIGRGARIGANAVVIDDVPTGMMVAGVPATVRGPAWKDEPAQPGRRA